MSKHTRVVNREHFSTDMRIAVRPLVDSIVQNSVEEYQQHLRGYGYKLTDHDYGQLLKVLSSEANASLSISVDITDKKLESWEINPIPVTQTTFDAEDGVWTEVDEGDDIHPAHDAPYTDEQAMAARLLAAEKAGVR